MKRLRDVNARASYQLRLTYASMVGARPAGGIAPSPLARGGIVSGHRDQGSGEPGAGCQWRSDRLDKKGDDAKADRQTRPPDADMACPRDSRAARGVDSPREANRCVLRKSVGAGDG